MFDSSRNLQMEKSKAFLLNNSEMGQSQASIQLFNEKTRSVQYLPQDSGYSTTNRSVDKQLRLSMTGNHSAVPGSFLFIGADSKKLQELGLTRNVLHQASKGNFNSRTILCGNIA